MISFPWPPKQLSPNVKSHWAAKAKAAKQYKSDCIKTLWTRGPWQEKYECLTLVVLFAPPDRRRRDIDNALSSFKYGIDAIAHFSKVDDSKFEIIPRFIAPTKGGRVEVMISGRSGVLIP